MGTDANKQREGRNAEGREADADGQTRFDPALLAALGGDEAMIAAGDRLATRADHEAVPLAVVRLPAPDGEDERP